MPKCTKCNGRLAKDWLNEDTKWIPSLKCINCGKQYYERASKEEIEATNTFTQIEIGERLGITRQAVSLIEEKALRKLRDAATSVFKGNMRKEDLL